MLTIISTKTTSMPNWLEVWFLDTELGLATSTCHLKPAWQSLTSRQTDTRKVLNRFDVGVERTPEVFFGSIGIHWWRASGGTLYYASATVIAFPWKKHSRGTLLQQSYRHHKANDKELRVAEDDDGEMQITRSIALAGIGRGLKKTGDCKMLTNPTDDDN